MLQHHYKRNYHIKSFYVLNYIEIAINEFKKSNPQS
nr:MAG TPA: hypothetical protein [Caudoviricetes sp.]